MRTTVSIDDALLDSAKKGARERGVTLGQYVESALRNEIAAPRTSAARFDPPTFARGTGMRNDIDPSSNRDLFDALDASADIA
ncbi:hypothetical protein [Subtercola endophyticus]|uniref:hypothetical protein n=1 Tax=Subtercola endophyticus TaxID=2895559 RepID=UPI001E51C3C1|nr:hypothetical protein [Subtercola endophyticus]UFS58848.1 hypothetical protein LQ955_17915 [Subtercola endophyticus]